jgi:putative DNA primase/helicase
MFNRQADNWRPLLSIADLAGGDWPEHARAVAEKVCGSDEDETSVRVQLLMDIGALFHKHNTDRLASALIAQELAERGREICRVGADGEIRRIERPCRRAATVAL